MDQHNVVKKEEKRGVKQTLFRKLSRKGSDRSSGEDPTAGGPNSSFSSAGSSEGAVEMDSYYNLTLNDTGCDVHSWRELKGYFNDRWDFEANIDFGGRPAHPSRERAGEQRQGGVMRKSRP